MPVCFIEVPAGLSRATRERLIADASAAIHAAYPIADTRIFLREYAPESLGQDGRFADAPRPVCFLDVPPGVADAAKRQMVQALSAGVRAAVGSPHTLVFVREHALANVAHDGGLQSENARVVAAVRQLQG